MAEHSESQSVVRGTAIVGALTLLSRVTGFVRELLTARLLGSGFFSDAFFVAFRIPNLLRSFVAEGALTSAFVPVFAGELHKGRAEAQRALSNIAGFLLIITAALSMLGIIYAPEIVRLFGFSEDKSALCAELTQIMFPYLMMVSAVALLNGVLNSLKIFGTAAWAQIITNIVLISGAALGFLFDITVAAKLLAWSVIVGGLCGALYQLPALKRANLRFAPRFALFSPEVRAVVALMLPAIFGAAIYQITIFVSTMFASLLQEGSVSWLFYADRLAQLPIGIFTVALGTVLLPALASLHARNDTAAFTASIERALAFTSVIILPVAVALFLFSEPLMIALFEGGRFTRHSSDNAAIALQAMALGLWGASCHTIGIRAFLARRDTITPAVLGVLSLIVGVVLSLLLMGAPHAAHLDSQAIWVRKAQLLLGSLFPLFNFGHVGLAASSSAAALVSFFLLLALLLRRLPDLRLRSFVLSTFKAFIAATVSLFLILASDLFSLTPLLQILIGMPLFFASYILIAQVLYLREVQQGFSLIADKLRRK